MIRDEALHCRETDDMEYENKPLVSVMLCTYNGAEFIRDTIESVLS